MARAPGGGGGGPASPGGFSALKPSSGRIRVYPPYMGRVAGPMTRTVSDAALLTNVLSRPDPRDFMSLPEIDFDFSSGLDEIKPNRLKIGFLPDMNAGLPVHPEVRAAAQAAAQALSDSGGGGEETQSFLTPDMLDGMTRFFEARSYNDYMQLPAPRRGKVLPFIAEWCTWRAERFSGRDVMQAYTLVMAMREAAVAACQRFDYGLSPTSPILPYEAESAAPGDDPRTTLLHTGFTVAYNMSEQPAASINWSWSAAGLPIGVQLIGKRFDDAGVLKLARLVEKLRPPQRPWPE